MALDPNINTLEKAKFLEHVGETAVRVYVVNQQGDSVKNSGIENVIDGMDYATIVFTTAMQNVNYVPQISIECDDENPIFLNWVIKSKTVLGMTVQFNAPVDSPNYYVSFSVSEPTQ